MQEILNKIGHWLGVLIPAIKTVPGADDAIKALTHLAGELSTGTANISSERAGKLARLPITATALAIVEALKEAGEVTGATVVTSTGGHGGNATAVGGTATGGSGGDSVVSVGGSSKGRSPGN